MLNFAAISPHPPLIIPAIGRNYLPLVKKTVHAMEKLAAEIKKVQPHTIIIISPHGPMRYDKFTINMEEIFKGDFSQFGVEKGETYRFKNNQSLSWKLLKHLRAEHYPVEAIREEILDYGSLVPLYYLTAELKEKPAIIPLTFTAMDWNMHFNFGKEIAKVIQIEEESIVLVASGDLSHRLTQDAPAEYSPYGAKFDHTLLELLKKNETEKILNLNPEFCDEAGECGLRSILITLGVLSEVTQSPSFQQLSYEAPFGVGYLVGQWKIR
jgi:aromatic ring-opening dioxygenase LigB subunit